MFRITSVSVLSLALAAIGHAGQFQIGGGVNGVNGLTSAYVNGNCGGGCITGTSSTFVEQNYDSVLFSGATNGGTPPTPYATYSSSTANAGTLTDSTNGVTFSMINDGTQSGLSNNVWTVGQSASLPTMTIPIGIFGVTDVWTMLNDELGTASPNRDATLFFNFGNSANATTVQTITVKLTNSANSTTPTGQIRNAVDCVPPSASCGGITNAASGALAGSSVISGVTVLTGNVYSGAYNAASGAYSGSTGSIVLDDQGFFFNSIALTTLGAGKNNLNSYLVSVQVREAGAVAGASIGLSAVSVDAVPEPSTILMLLSGLGAIGFSKIRRRK
jgi:hypothetical protein